MKIWLIVCSIILISDIRSINNNKIELAIYNLPSLTDINCKFYNCVYDGISSY